MAGCLLLLTPTWPVAAADHQDSLPNFDRRKERQNFVPARASRPERAAAESRLRGRLPELQTEWHEVVGSPKWVSARQGFLTGKNGIGRGGPARLAATVPAGDPHRVLKSFVDEHAALFGHDSSVLDRARLKRQFITSHNGVRTAIWHQEHHGIEVFEGVFLAHITQDGELINVASQFVPGVAGNLPGEIDAAAAAPLLTVEDALRLTARNLGEELQPNDTLTAVTPPEGPERRQRFTATFLKAEASARLTWLPMDGETLRLCWRVMMKTRNGLARYRVLVDAQTGELMVRHGMTTDLSDASYRVYTGASPTPFSPGYNIPGNTNQPPQVNRQLVTLSALNTTASPLGWITDGVNETVGNNVNAHADANGDDLPDLPRPAGSPNRVFDFPIDLTQGPSTHRSASIVNLFYWCNWMHDKLWELGFTEDTGNFQTSNFGRGGVGGDAVLAQAQDGEAFNNANFSYTDDDGEVCYLQMFLWNDATPDRDGSLDTEIMLHEYTHGLSQRLVGAGIGLSEVQSQGMGEGWSDFYALSLLSQSNDSLAANYPKAAYVLFDYLYDNGGYPRFRENYYFGIRRYPYSTDMSKSPLTFKDIDFNQASPHADVPMSQRRPFSGGGEVHDQGEVWCAMLWEARANLIQKHGFTTGNPLILRIVMDGMKLSPPNPNFVQARDAILQAELALTGGANRTELWRAFAKRGLGYYATSPFSSTTTGVHEDFEPSLGLRIFAPTNLVIQGLEGGPFTGASRTFTLQNDAASSLNWSVFAEPPLEASAVSGTVPAGQSRTMTVTLDANAAAFFPIGLHSLTLGISNHVTHVVHPYVITLDVRSSAASLTEDFSSGGLFDLQNRSLTFHPLDASNYRVCRDIVSSLPVSTTFAATLQLEDTEVVKVTLAGGKRVVHFGHEYSSVYVSRNGALTFSVPEEGSHELADHFAQSRVSAYFRSLGIGASSRVSWQQLSNSLVVSWERMETALSDDTNTFQVQMFFDGAIRMTWNRIEGYIGIVGLSDGQGMPEGFLDADFSALPDCDFPPLKLTLPSVVSEGNGQKGGRVAIPTSRSSPTVVSLLSSDTTELTAPATVIIPARETEASFNVTVLNDLVRDGSQLVYVTASALNFVSDQVRVRVDDDDNNPLTLTVPLLASESQGVFSGVVTVPNPVSGVVTVSLSSSRTNEITVQPMVFIPAGQTSAVFKATVIDDRRIDGNLTTTITASVPGWSSGADAITIVDNEDRLLRMFVPFLMMEGSGTLSNAGNVYLSGTLETNLTVSLWTSNFFALIPLGPVTIPAGATNTLFSIAVGDNADIDGVRLVQLAATAPAFSNAVSSIFLFDNDQPPTPANPYPPDDSTNWPTVTHLAWDAAEGELIVNGDFETGDFTGWTVGGYGGGGWMLNDGTLDPDSADGPRPALAGAFNAIAVQNGNGRHTLSQEIQIPDGATSGTMLRWRQELRNHSGIYDSSQRFSVELRDAATEALLATLYSTTPTNLAFEGPANRSASVAAWRGQRVRIVFVEDDALGDFNVHLDNISVIATSASPTTYDVYFGTDAVPDATEYRGSTTNATWDLLPLAGGLNYYWRIDSRRQGITNTGPVWHFTTAGSSTSTTPLTFGSAWKYVATGVNLGTAWSSPSYNDVLWQTGTAPFGFGSSEVTTIGAASNDVTTFYFRRRLTVFDTNRLAVVTASLKRDDGAIVYINGVEAFRDNMPASRVDYLTQASTIVTGADETNSVIHPIDPSFFIEGTNIVAVEVHQRDNGIPFPGPSPDLFFDLAFTFRTNTGNLMPLAVNWLAPSDFSTFGLPGNLTVRVGVVDDNLFGASVEFFGDGRKFAEDFVTPFQVAWTNPPVGLRTLQAVVTDPGGLTRTSAPLHVLVVPSGGQSMITLIPAGAVWRYRQNGEDPGRDWTRTGYREPKDGSWKGGPAQLGYGDGDEATVFDLNLEFGRRPITAYFRHPFEAAIKLSSLNLRVVRDDGAAVYLNGAEVWRNNLPAGTLTPGTLAVAGMSPPNENAWLSASLSPSLIVSGANVAAAEVHQSSQNNPDLSFDLELTGVGNFLPEVAITSPGSALALLSPASVQIAAAASDPYGEVTGVQFFSNGVLLGSDSTAPYGIAWTNPLPGIHALTAVATDNSGALSTSSPVQLVIVPSVGLSVRGLGIDTVELTWPGTAPGYRVETCASLEPPIFWIPTTNAVTQANGVFRVLVTPSVEQQYFRLVAP